MRIVIFCFIVLLLTACNDNNDDNDGPLNHSDEFAICNSVLSDCSDGNGQYCLFGFKWGQNNTFIQTGVDALGPKESGGIVTFSFQEENGIVNTHRQVNLPSRSFNNIIGCAKIEIRNALNSWSEVADIEFEELPENSESDIRFYVADIVQSGIGYPNFSNNQCKELAGNVIIQSNVRVNNCNQFYAFVLHEIGHVLGLGHVNSSNIMNPGFSSLKLSILQSGDSTGIIEIYGKKQTGNK